MPDENFLGNIPLPCGISPSANLLWSIPQGRPAMLMLLYSNDLVLPPILDKKSRHRQIYPALESQKILSYQLRHGGQGSASGEEVASELDQGE
jgi:hypothetical protein